MGLAARRFYVQIFQFFSTEISINGWSLGGGVYITERLLGKST
jgi:hypothetical protein